MDWRLAEAKNKFSEVVNKALAEGPQRIRRRSDTVVLIALEDYEKLTGARPGLKDFLLGEGPHLEDLDLDRSRSLMRDVDL